MIVCNSVWLKGFAGLCGCVGGGYVGSGSVAVSLDSCCKDVNAPCVCNPLPRKERRKRHKQSQGCCKLQGVLHLHVLATDAARSVASAFTAISAARSVASACPRHRCCKDCCV
eukprot:1158120-Pelagomonas_calceolata.AAC.9